MSRSNPGDRNDSRDRRCSRSFRPCFVQRARRGQAGRREGRCEGGKEGREEGRQEGEEGRKGREEGRKDRGPRSGSSEVASFEAAIGRAVWRPWRSSAMASFFFGE